MGGMAAGISALGSNMGGSQHVRRSRQEKNRGFGASVAPDSGHSGLTGRFEAVSRMYGLGVQSGIGSIRI